MIYSRSSNRDRGDVENRSRFVCAPPQTQLFPASAGFSTNGKRGKFSPWGNGRKTGNVSGIFACPFLRWRPEEGSLSLWKSFAQNSGKYQPDFPGNFSPCPAGKKPGEKFIHSQGRTVKRRAVAFGVSTNRNGHSHRPVSGLLRV